MGRTFRVSGKRKWGHRPIKFNFICYKGISGELSGRRGGKFGQAAREDQNNGLSSYGEIHVVKEHCRGTLSASLIGSKRKKSAGIVGLLSVKKSLPLVRKKKGRERGMGEVSSEGRDETSYDTTTLSMG